MSRVGMRLRRTYGDRTMLLRVDRRMGSARFGKVRPDSRTGTTCTTRGWGSGGVKTGFGAHLHREPAHPGRRAVPRHHAPDRLARARPGADSVRGRNRRVDSHRTSIHPTRPQSPGKPIPPAANERPQGAPNQRSGRLPRQWALPKSSARPGQSTGRKAFVNYPTRSSLPQVTTWITNRFRRDGGCLARGGPRCGKPWEVRCPGGMLRPAPVWRSRLGRLCRSRPDDPTSASRTGRLRLRTP